MVADRDRFRSTDRAMLYASLAFLALSITAGFLLHLGLVDTLQRSTLWTIRALLMLSPLVITVGVVLSSWRYRFLQLGIFAAWILGLVALALPVVD